MAMLLLLLPYYLFFGYFSSRKSFSETLQETLFLAGGLVKSNCFFLLKFQKLGDITEMAFGGRYVILMMSLFSIYTGLIYNEFFSVPFGLFGRSAYECRSPDCRYYQCSL